MPFEMMQEMACKRDKFRYEYYHTPLKPATKHHSLYAPHALGIGCVPARLDENVRVIDREQLFDGYPIAFSEVFNPAVGFDRPPTFTALLEALLRIRCSILQWRCFELAGRIEIHGEKV